MQLLGIARPCLIKDTPALRARVSLEDYLVERTAEKLFFLSAQPFTRGECSNLWSISNVQQRALSSRTWILLFATEDWLQFFVSVDIALVDAILKLVLLDVSPNLLGHFSTWARI